MKASHKILAVILVVVIACILISTTIVLLRKPIVLNDWSGEPPLNTTVPTLTLGWWNSVTTVPTSTSTTPTARP